LLFSPLIFGAGGVAVVRSFYKSSRGGLGFFPPTLAQKSSCLLFSLLPSSPPRPTKRSTLLVAMAGDDAWPPSNVTWSVLDAHVKAGILHPITDARLPE